MNQGQYYTSKLIKGKKKNKPSKNINKQYAISGDILKAGSVIEMQKTAKRCSNSLVFYSMLPWEHDWE